ncbi:MAG: hypothetical protein ACJ8F7_06100 [Gemmataceae bacterium]
MTTNWLPPTDDQMGRLLRDYYRSRIPVFPPAAVVVAEPAPTLSAPQRSRLVRSRWVMAVCLALVLGALGWLMGQNPAYRSGPPAGFNHPTASPRTLFTPATPGWPDSQPAK